MIRPREDMKKYEDAVSGLERMPTVKNAEQAQRASMNAWSTLFEADLAAGEISREYVTRYAHLSLKCIDLMIEVIERNSTSEKEQIHVRNLANNIIKRTDFVFEMDKYGGYHVAETISKRMEAEKISAQSRASQKY